MIAKPAEPDLERSYVGGVLLDPSVLDAHVPVEAISNDLHRRVFECALAVLEHSDRVDAEQLDAELSSRGWFRGPGTFDRYAGFVGNAEPLARRLRELYRLRQIREKALEVAARAEQTQESSEVHRAIEDLAEVASGGTAGPPLSTMREVVREGVERIVKAHSGGINPLIATGIPDLDEHVGGWAKGDMAVIGGDPSAGKSTTFLLAALQQAANGHRPGIVSIEDSRERWFRRAAATRAGIPIKAIKTSSLTSEQFDSLKILVADSELELTFAWALGAPLDEVIACIRALIAKGCDVIYVDYLQAIEGGQSDQAFRFFVKRCLTAMRREANRPGFEVPIILGSQFRKRDDETSEPKNADLYEAAYIHQKADSIVLLWKDESGFRNWTLSKAKDDEVGVRGVLWKSPDPRRGFFLSTEEATGIGLDHKRDKAATQAVERKRVESSSYFADGGEQGADMFADGGF